MRLINAKTLKLEEFIDGRSAPKYAILSHTWCKDEVLFHDMAQLDGVARKKKGWKKIELTCVQALKDGFAYAWVDTCCIDKSSSAELSEAINSMFAWYRDSAICYVYLYDVLTDPLQLGDLPCLFGDAVDYYKEDSPKARPSTLEIAPQLSQSRWFTRGWTLQELLAPAGLELYGRDWSYLGAGQDLIGTISSITKIKSSVLRKKDRIESCSVACRMSWAARRTTTRIEDEAYSLLGIFGINMPLLYGESNKAFVRLQREIIRTTTDQSILAWNLASPLHDRDEHFDEFFFALASSVARFENSGAVVPLLQPIPQSVLQVTQRGIEVMVLMKKNRRRRRKPHQDVVLNCIDESRPMFSFVLKLRHWDTNVRQITDVNIPCGASLERIPRETLKKRYEPKIILLKEDWAPLQIKSKTGLLRIRCAVNDWSKHAIRIQESHPPDQWESSDLYRMGNSGCAFRVEIKDQRQTGASTSTRFTMLLHGHYGVEIAVLKDHEDSSHRLDVLCDLAKTQEWMFETLYANFQYLSYVREPKFIAAGSYIVRITYDPSPQDDAFPRLLIAVYRRSAIRQMLSEVQSLLPLIRHQNHFSDMEMTIEDEENIPTTLDLAELHSYGTWWQRFRMRFAKFQPLDSVVMDELSAASNSLSRD